MTAARDEHGGDATESAARDARVVLVTAPDAASALGLARQLVEERLIACANILPGITSVYRWEGSVREDSEVMLVLKTATSCIAELERRFHELHSYDVPEFCVLEPDHISPGYLSWLLVGVGPSA